ncbi:small ribosomal subunit protein eS1-like [Myotis yumanensis]|uniref:small ribosomal subunit protein eS1-like n=1 Tax=Myotis yumanensis TaxID=159337 RepID=UPI0038D1DA2F
MAVGKKKRLTKGGEKGAKKKVVDPFSKKDWCDVKAPALFCTKDRKTLVTRTQGTKIAPYSATFKHTVQPSIINCSYHAVHEILRTYSN